ncbi:MAG: carbohydrate binding domain-containing protein, partial [Clostridia bacterium]|nr:carbohydrate binding domain-containing protein [Clostridia bacterium]
MTKTIRKILSVVCAIVLAVGAIAPAWSVSAQRMLPWLEEDNLLEQILQRDGYLEGVWFPWFTHDNLGHGLTGNDTMMKWAHNRWYDFSSVGLDAYGAAKVYQEIYNLKAMGFNIMAYAGSAYGEGVIYDDNGDVLGIKKDYLQNVRRFLDMCRQVGMPLLWNICFHSSSVPDYYGMESWWIINAMYGDPTIADHYAERFVRPLCKVLAEYPDVIAIVALTDEIENETNDSEIGNLFSGGRAMYGTTLADIQYFVSAMNDVVKEEMPDVARTIAANNVDKARYGDLDLDLNGHNTYSSEGDCGWPEDMVANAPVFLSEYNVSSSSNYSEAEMTRRHTIYRDNMKARGLIGGFMWAWQPTSRGGPHDLLAAGTTTVTDFREFVYAIRHYAIDSRNQHRGITGALDAPSFFFNLGNGIVEWIPSRQATRMDLLSSTNGGKTWTTLLDNVPQSDYLQGFKCVYKDRRANTDTIYKIVARDDAGNTVESVPSNDPEEALGFVQNPYTSVSSLQPRLEAQPAEFAVKGERLGLTLFADAVNRPRTPEINLIQNGSFEAASGGQWMGDTFLGAAVSVVEDSTAPDGGKSLYFNSSATKDPAWYTFTVDVEKNTDYVFSAWVKGAYLADDSRFTASIGVLNPGTRTFMVYDSYKGRTSMESMQIYPTAWDEEWHLRSVSFNSGNQTQISIGLYGCASRMWVDDIALFKKTQGITYKSANLMGSILSVLTDADYCADEDSLTENVHVDDDSSDYWQTGSGWKNGFMSIQPGKVGYGTSLKYEAINPTGVYYIKWVDVQPNTDYVFSTDVKVLESGSGELRLMTDVKKKPTVFFESPFSQEIFGEEWNSVRTTFNSGPFTRIGIAVIDKGGAALLDNIRLFETQDAAEGDDAFIEREPLNGWV